MQSPWLTGEICTDPPFITTPNVETGTPNVETVTPFITTPNVETGTPNMETEKFSGLLGLQLTMQPLEFKTTEQPRT